MKVEELKRKLDMYPDEMEIGLFMLNEIGEPEFFEEIGIEKCSDMEIFGIDEKNNFVAKERQFLLMSWQQVLSQNVVD